MALSRTVDDATSSGYAERAERAQSAPPLEDSGCCQLGHLSARPHAHRAQSRISPRANLPEGRHMRWVDRWGRASAWRRASPHLCPSSRRPSKEPPPAATEWVSTSGTCPSARGASMAPLQPIRAAEAARVDHVALAGGGGREGRLGPLLHTWDWHALCACATKCKRVRIQGTTEQCGRMHALHALHACM